jgi:hypothetical protein
VSVGIVDTLALSIEDLAVPVLDERQKMTVVG